MEIFFFNISIKRKKYIYPASYIFYKKLYPASYILYFEVKAGYKNFVRLFRHPFLRTTSFGAIWFIRSVSISSAEALLCMTEVMI